MLKTLFSSTAYANMKAMTDSGRHIFLRAFRAALLVGISLTVVNPSLVALELDACKPVRLEKGLMWPTSGTLLPDRESLLVVDVLAEKILEISLPDGAFLDGFDMVYSGLSGKAVALSKPSYIHPDPSGGGFFVEDEEADIVHQLDQRMVAEKSIQVKRQSGRFVNKSAVRQASIGAIYDWQPMRRGFLAFADLKYEGATGPEDQWESVFLHFTEHGIEHTLGDPIDILDELRNHYTAIQMPYLASLDGEAGFILNMNQSPSISKVDIDAGSIRTLGSFPLSQSHVPRLTRNPKWMGPRQNTAFLRTLESSEMPTGIYATSRRLYLVAKEAIRDDGSTTWLLIPVDPDNGEALLQKPIILPTDAAHITLVIELDGKKLVIIEKGPVEGIGSTHAPYMPTSSMVVCDLKEGM
jgi:hypothetical protein